MKQDKRKFNSAALRRKKALVAMKNRPVNAFAGSSSKSERKAREQALIDQVVAKAKEKEAVSGQQSANGVGMDTLGVSYVNLGHLVGSRVG